MEIDAETMMRLTLLEEKIGETYKYTKRLYTIMVWTGIITVAAIVLPIIGLLFALPSFFSAYSNMGNTDSTASQSQGALKQATDLEKTLKDLLK